MVNWTFGAGGTYADLDAAWTALIGASPLADDYTLTQVGNCTEAAWGAGTVNTNGFNVTITNQSRPLGNPLTGNRILVQADMSLVFTVSGGGEVLIEQLYIIQNQLNAGGATNAVFLTANGTTARIDGCLIQGRSTAQFQWTGLTLSSDATGIAIGTNIKVWNCYIGVQIATIGPVVVCENLTIYENNFGISIVFSGTRTIRNCVTCANVTSDYNLVGGTDPTFEYCADSDGTLPEHTGRVQNIVPANEFFSTSTANSRFLDLFDGTANQAGFTATPNEGKAPLEVRFSANIQYDPVAEQLSRSGIAPTYATVDIAGNARPGEDGQYSIGAHEVQYTEV